MARGEGTAACSSVPHLLALRGRTPALGHGCGHPRGPGRSPTRSLNLGRRDAGVSPDSARSGYPEERFAIDGAQFARPR